MVLPRGLEPRPHWLKASQLTRYTIGAKIVTIQIYYENDSYVNYRNGGFIFQKYDTPYNTASITIDQSDTDNICRPLATLEIK